MFYQEALPKWLIRDSGKSLLQS